MNTSGNIRYLDEDESPKENEMLLSDLQAKGLIRQSPKVRKNWMRNKPCTCGSGKKMKKCCWYKLARLNSKIVDTEV